MKTRNVKLAVPKDLLTRAGELGLDLSQILTAALQEHVDAARTPTAQVYHEKPASAGQREQDANKLRVSKRVFANVPLGME